VSLAVLAGALALFAGVAGTWAVVRGTTPGSLPADGLPATSAVVSTATPDALSTATDVCTTSFDFAEKEEQVFDAFYTNRREVLGLTIVGGPDVPSAALDAAEVTLLRVFEHNAHEEILARQGAYIIVAEADQGVLDLPEFACLEDELGTNFFTHVCGIADRADYPVVTVNALDLLGSSRGPCDGVNILYHELGHMVHNFAADPPDHLESRWLYADAMAAGLYEGKYAATNYREYFAEGTQSYFDAQDREGRFNRSWLEEYDPELYELLRRVYGD
jgi:hypothetical protein